jgi:D-arabinose 5-phosphate isomerase GutQ
MWGGSRSDCASRAISGSGMTNDMAAVASVSKYCGLEQISLGSNREDSQRFVNERVCRH